MLTYLIIGTFGALTGLILGFGWDSIIIFFATFALDGDIVVNELFRIFIKKEKKIDVKNFLDEYSYTHKFLFHLPLVILPAVFIFGLFYKDAMFGFLLFLMVLYHLFHDTVDNNFDGVSWLWPFSSDSYKIKNDYLIIKTRKELKEEAHQMAKNSRNFEKILKDNTVF